MAHIHRSLPKKGSPIGIAFSGGLDTRAAVAWLHEQGMAVHAYTADLAQPDVTAPAEIPPVALRHGAKQAKLVDCRAALAREGLVALQCGAFHLSTAGRPYFNTTPLARAVTATAIVREMKKDGVGVFSDGSTHKGNDIQRFFRYGLLIDPALEIYKPWLDAVFVDALGGRREMSAYLERKGLPYAASAEKAYSTDANLLGSSHEAKDLENLSSSMHIVEPLMGVAHWRSDVAIAPERLDIVFERGRPVSIGAEHFGANLLAVLQAANAAGGRHGLGMSDQIENRVIEAKSRGIYEAPGMALLRIAYERLISAVHNEETIELYQTLGRKLGRLLYAGRWYDPEAAMLKHALVSTVAAPLSGRVSVELRRGEDYTILDTQAEASAYSPEKLSMEKVASAFSPSDRIGALELQALGIDDNRVLLERLAPLNADVDAWRAP